MISNGMLHRCWSLWLQLIVTCVVLLLPPSARAQQPDQWKQARQELVELIAEGVKDPRVLKAVANTERHLFVPEADRQNSYFDMSLPIGDGVTISPPYVVAFMTEQLDPQSSDRVLEIGTGSGYQAAILSPLVSQVYTIEIIESLGNEAAERLQKLGYDNVHVRVGDGYKGWPENAPFDKIIVTCSPEKIPQPLIDQLKEGGKLLIPLGNRYQQSLCLVTKREGKLERRVLESTFFVPMTGRAEEVRSVKQDDGVPVLANGSFEELTGEQAPADWFYLRQAEIVSGPTAADGKRYLKLSNTTPGRAAHALQSIGLDGRRFKEVEISVSIRSVGVEFSTDDSFAGIKVYFYDEQRRQIGSGSFGSWRGSSPWSEYVTRFPVPAEARILGLNVGLYGASGELDIDHLRLDANAAPTNGPFE